MEKSKKSKANDTQKVILQKGRRRLPASAQTTKSCFPFKPLLLQVLLVLLRTWTETPVNLEPFSEL